ncbi:MAG TPA: GNVR domain-containing protein, partial [Rhodothermales bacterium]|nr:GNVR domain-containing protein [Rhodothermales bacterium]
ARLIGIVFAVIFAAFALYAFLAPATYTAHSLLLINPQRPAGADQAIVGSFVDVPGLDSRKVLNQALILQQAPAIAERTAQRILARPDAAGFPVVQTLGGAPTVEELAEYLQNEVVQVSQEGNETDAVRVEASSSSAEEAATLARVYTEEYVALTSESSRAHITRLRTFLEEQVALRRGELDETEQQLATYQASAQAVALDVQTASTVQQIATLQAALDGARVDAQMRAASLASLEREATAIQPRMAASAAATAAPELAGIETQIDALERQLDQIYLRNPEFRGNPDAHPDLRTLTDRLASLQREKQRLASQAAADVMSAGGLDPTSTGSNGPGYVADLRRQIAEQRAALNGANASAGALASRLGEASGALTSVPERARRLAGLERNRSATAQLLASLMGQLEQARVAEESDFGLVQVVREARTPLVPSSPNIPLLLAVGGLLGLLAGLGGAVGRHRLDARTHTPADLGESGFTVLGTIPDLGDRAGRPRVPADGARVPATLVALTEPFSPEAEAFRHLHAAVLGAGGPGGTGPQVLLIAGPEVSTGKSLVSANLAVVAAQAGRRVLLLDADLRCPAVPLYLGLGDGPPLGEGPEGANVVYWNTVVPGLFAVTAREAADQPEALWSSEQAARLLAHLRESFDLVIVDAPAALVAADAAVLAPHCDAALLVAEAGRTDADALGQVAAELAGTGLRQIAAVLNRFDARRAVGYRKTFGYRHATRYASAPRKPVAPAVTPAATPAIPPPAA